MTFKEKLILDHPEFTEYDIRQKVMCRCPSDYGYERQFDCYEEWGMKMHCRACWFREMPAAKTV